MRIVPATVTGVIVDHSIGPQNKAASTNSIQGARNVSSEPQGQQLVYVADVSLDRTQMQVNGKLVNLQPGMAVTAEIRTGARNVMSYLLSPLLRLKNDSLHER